MTYALIIGAALGTILLFLLAAASAKRAARRSRFMALRFAGLAVPRKSGAAPTGGVQGARMRQGSCTCPSCRMPRTSSPLSATWPGSASLGAQV